MNIRLSAAILWGVVIWISALVYSIFLMDLLGIDYTDPDVEFGLGHEKYWLFEVIMTPSFLLFALMIFRFYFVRSQSTDWKGEALNFGIIVMVIQFILDTIVLVYSLDNGWTYFLGLVTVTYLMIPLWSYLVALVWHPAKPTD